MRRWLTAVSVVANPANARASSCLFRPGRGRRHGSRRRRSRAGRPLGRVGFRSSAAARRSRVAHLKLESERALACVAAGEFAAYWRADRVAVGLETPQCFQPTARPGRLREGVISGISESPMTRASRMSLAGFPPISLPPRCGGSGLTPKGWNGLTWRRCRRPVPSPPPPSMAVICSSPDEQLPARPSSSGSGPVVARSSSSNRRRISAKPYRSATQGDALYLAGQRHERCATALATEKRRVVCPPAIRRRGCSRCRRFRSAPPTCSIQRQARRRRFWPTTRSPTPGARCPPLREKLRRWFR